LVVTKKAAKAASMLATETTVAPVKRPIQEVAHGKKEKEEKSKKSDVLSPESSGVIDPADMKARLRARGTQSPVERIADSRKALEHPCPPGMKFFETHDGEIIVGDGELGQVWCDRLQGGKGAWVLPMR
jgi:hypothetical protein